MPRSRSLPQLAGAVAPARSVTDRAYARSPTPFLQRVQNRFGPEPGEKPGRSPAPAASPRHSSKMTVLSRIDGVRQRMWRRRPPDGWHEHLTRTPKPIEPQAVDEPPVDRLGRDYDAAHGHQAAGARDGRRAQQRRRGADQQFTSRHR